MAPDLEMPMYSFHTPLGMDFRFMGTLMDRVGPGKPIHVCQISY